MSRTSIALGNLRAVVIVIVLAFHSSLAYLGSLPTTPYRFDSPPYLWQAIPIIDRERWFGLDLFCAWQDVSLMSMMFFLSGLFVPSSLARKGSWKFLSDRFVPGWTDRLGRLAEAVRNQPLRFFVILSCASALAYIPMALVFLPWEWTHFGLFSFQLSRPLHYLVYFFAGFAIGVRPLDRGLLACDGSLAQRSLFWLGAGLIGFGLWAAPTSTMLDDPNAPLPLQLAAAYGFALACASGCFALLAVCLRFASERRRTLDSLSANAYGMYLLHYVFMVWMQFALMEVALVAVTKATIVFAVTLTLSWALSAAAGGLSFDAKLAGVKQ